MGIRKKAISIRISDSDVRRIKRVAKRLGVRDSDVIRFAVKSMLARIAPLHDPTMRGRSLVPVFLESGLELLHHFELDVMRLENIINEDVDDDRRVDHEDIQLIAMIPSQPPFLRWQLTSTTQGAADGHADAGRDADRKPADSPLSRISSEGLMPSLREYLYGKYVRRDSARSYTPPASELLGSDAQPVPRTGTA